MESNGRAIGGFDENASNYACFGKRVRSEIAAIAAAIALRYRRICDAGQRAAGDAR
jgi:hypothetical protein